MRLQDQAPAQTMTFVRFHRVCVCVYPVYTGYLYRCLLSMLMLQKLPLSLALLSNKFVEIEAMTLTEGTWLYRTKNRKQQVSDLVPVPNVLWTKVEGHKRHLVSLLTLILSFVFHFTFIP